MPSLMPSLMDNIQWRDSMRSPKLYVVDLRLFVLMLAWAFWPRIWTLVPVLIVMGFLVVVGHKGYRPGAALRALRRWVGGSTRAWSPRRYRRLVDYGAAGGLAILVIAGGRTDANAEFVYTPPDPPETRSSPPIVRPVPEDGEVVTTGGVGGDLPVRSDGAAAEESGDRAVQPARDQWRVASGSTLAAILADWASRAEVEVVMLTDREYRIESSHTFAGAFGDAVQALLSGLGHLSYAPVGEMLDNGRMLVVRHRARTGHGVRN